MSAPLIAGGLTLGAAAALGAVIGGSAQTLRNYGERLKGKLKGQRELTVDDAVLRLLALRQRQLLAALATRGHAATTAIQLDDPRDEACALRLFGRAPLDPERRRSGGGAMGPHERALL